MGAAALATLLVLFDVAGGSEPDKRTAAYVSGDFIVGGLFPIHYQPSSKERHVASLGIRCGKVREHYGIQRAEVALQTVDRINEDPRLLPNVKLGVEIRDECWYAPVALQQSINLIRDVITPSSILDTCPGIVGPSVSDTVLSEKRGPLIGVVGPGSSSVALQVQNLLQLFHIPQIGYSTTSRDLSDKSRFNYFLRVVPSDYFQAQVILDIVRYFNWTYVSAVKTNENYGQSGFQAFKELAEKVDVCIAREDSVLSDAADEVFDKVVQNLRQDPKAAVVVCFCEGFTVKGLLKATKRLKITNHFLFIGSDGWADRDDVTESVEEEAWGGLSIRIHSPYVDVFDDYFESLRPATNLRNPWFKEFWQQKFLCTFSDDEDDPNYLSYYESTTAAEEGNFSVEIDDKQPQKICTGEEKLSSRHRQDSKLSFVIKAIYTLAHALHNMHQDTCGENYAGVCEKLLPFNGSLFKNYLMNVSFEYGNEIVDFDRNGDPPGRYDILNYQRLPNGTFGYVQVGSWNNHSLIWNSSKKIQFGLKHGEGGIKSVCAEDCPLGQYKNVQHGGNDKKCCWVCVPCPPGEIIDHTGNSCIKCPLGYAPDTQKIDCLQLPIEYVQWFDTVAIVAMSFSAFGFICTFFAFFVFVKHNTTPIVRSSTKELCYIILVGMTLSHASVFAILAKPSVITCALTRFVPGLSFAMIYASLLTKTNRIARILAGSKKRFPTRKPMFMSAGAQVVITSILVTVQIVISGAVLYMQPPVERSVYLPTRTLLECNITVTGLAVPLSFDVFLIILCTLYAVKTRNVPENFNEAKFIGFAMYTTCVIWIAFIPIYSGSDSKVITMCICVTLSATVPWLFLFLPKIYIIILEPEKNNRAFFTTTKIRCHIGSRVASAASEKSSTASWREDSIPPVKEMEKTQYEARSESNKRTLSCQTGSELLEILLRSDAFQDMCPPILCGPRITERDCCCDSDDCQVKNITIKFPDNPDLYNRY